MDRTEVLALVTLAKERDEKAFSQIYDLFAESLYRFISYKIPNREQAEDVLQDTFLKAWRALPKLSLDNLNFNAWLYRIARNAINDYYRTLKRRPTPDNLENYYDLSSDSNIEKEVSSNIDIEKLKIAIKNLPNSYQQILDLRFLQEFSIEETAKAMGRTEIAIRVAQHRAIKKLNSILNFSKDEIA